MFSQASTTRENLHCWRPGATAAPLSGLNRTCSPGLTGFVIASCASCVTTACSTDVRAHNIILTFHVARRHTDKLRRSRKTKPAASPRNPDIRGPKSRIGRSALAACIPLSARRSDIEGSRSAILPPPVTTLFLSIDRSGLTHPVSRVNSPKLINLSIGRPTQESYYALLGQGRDRHRRQFGHRQGSGDTICRGRRLCRHHRTRCRQS